MRSVCSRAKFWEEPKFKFWPLEKPTKINQQQFKNSVASVDVAADNFAPECNTFTSVFVCIILWLLLTTNLRDHVVPHMCFFNIIFTFLSLFLKKPLPTGVGHEYPGWILNFKFYWCWRNWFHRILKWWIWKIYISFKKNHLIILQRNTYKKNKERIGTLERTNSQSQLHVPTKNPFNHSQCHKRTSHLLLK